MHLPGQLTNTTLGDLLGALNRDSASGVLELIEPDGKRHHVEIRDGEIEYVMSDRGGPLLGDLLGLTDLPAVDDEQRLGDALLAEGRVDQKTLTRALSRQSLARLERLFEVKKASIRFHAPRPRTDDPTAPSPLGRDEFLSGRPRHRERETIESFPPARRQEGALAVLGLAPGATQADIRRAFRRLAQAHHPDRHPGAGESERVALFRRFSEISRAYHTLTG